jgi:type IV secretion system protein VirD4
MYRVVLSFFVLFIAAKAFAANVSHLSEMPSVDRVMREITGANPMETAARRMGAFEQLGEIVAELSEGRAAIGQPTADENRIIQSYQTARFQVQQSVVRTPQDEALLPSLRRFDEDPALRSELLNRFFSPALRARSAALSQELQARRAAMRANQTAFGGKATPPPTTPPTEPPVVIGPDGEPILTAEQIFWNWMESLAWLAPVILLGMYASWKARFEKGEPERNSRAELARFGNSVKARTAKIEDMFNRKTETLTFDLKGKALKSVEISGEIIRALAAMPQRDREMLRAVYHLFNAGKINAKDFYYTRLAFIYGDGKAQVLRPSPSNFPYAMNAFSNTTAEGAVSLVMQWIGKAAAKDPDHPVVKLLADRILGGGTASLSSSEAFTAAQNPAAKHALVLGIAEDTGKLVTFSGEGSLITVAPPRSGKTQSQVFPTLLTWKGPAVVLDVKGEIYEGTSKWRSENVGPVYKFAPLDPANSHSYNPLSAVRSDPDFLWEDARFLADMMMVPTDAKDPFWENRARDVLTAAIARACLTDDPAKRSLGTVIDVFHGVGWDDFVRELQARVDIRSMMRAGTSLGEMERKTRDGVLQTGLSSLSAWDGDRIERATRKSDWNPLDLRGGKNPTIYICLKPNEVDSYISILRVFIAQHIRMLTAVLPPRDASPILFMLDELPRLRHMPSVEEALEIGAGFGIKLWMFIQSLSQLENAYAKSEGMIGNCAVRMFMNPSLHDETAQKISDDIGFQEGVLDGQRQKIVEAPVLAGPDYKDYVIVMASGFKPFRLKKNFAYLNEAIRSRMGSL